MNNSATSSAHHPIVFVSFDDAYAARVVLEIERVCPTVHVSPLKRTLERSLDSLHPAIAVFDLQSTKTEEHSIFEIMASVNESHPMVRKLALGHSNVPAQVISAMRAGACDYIERESPPEAVRKAVVRLLRQVRSLQSQTAGLTVAIVGARENDGEVPIAVNLAAQLAAERERGDVLLLDLDLTQSQLDVEFDAEITYSVQNALDELLRLDKSVLSKVVAQHESGLYLMPLSTLNRSSEEISPQQLATVLGALRNFFPIVIVNAGCLRDKYCQSYLLPLCDKVLLVCPQTIGAIREGREIFREASAGTDSNGKFGIVVSRYDPNITLSTAQIASHIGFPIAGIVQDASAALANAHNEGRPLVLAKPSSRFGRSIRDLAELLVRPEPAVTRKPTKHGLLHWVGKVGRMAG